MIAYRVNRHETTNAHHQFVSVNPTTGLTTTVTFDDNDSTDDISETVTQEKPISLLEALNSGRLSFVVRDAAA